MAFWSMEEAVEDGLRSEVGRFSSDGGIRRSQHHYGTSGFRVFPGGARVGRSLYCLVVRRLLVKWRAAVLRWDDSEARRRLLAMLL